MIFIQIFFLFALVFLFVKCGAFLLNSWTAYVEYYHNGTSRGKGIFYQFLVICIIVTAFFVFSIFGLFISMLQGV